MDKQAFIEYYKKLHPGEKSTDSFGYVDSLPSVHSHLIFREIFDMIDVNKDGTIDFNEFLVVTVLINRVNDLGSRLSFAFDL